MTLTYIQRGAVLCALALPALLAAQDQTVYALGGASGRAVTSFVTTDTNTAVAATQARVRVVQLSPASGAIDVFITAVGVDLSAAAPTSTNLTYRSVTPYLLLAPGTYQVRAVPAGTAPANRAAAVTINLASLAVAGGNARSIVTADNISGGAPLRAFALADQ